MKALLEAGVHFGHQTRRWNPKMAPYIYTERNGIYIIDLQKTVKKLEEAYNFVRSISESGQNILFVGTKKQAQEAIKEEASRCGGYYVNARWLGGMMTNFKTMRTRVDRLNQLKTMQADGTFDMLPKKEVMKHLAEIGRVVYLKISFDELKCRLADFSERGVVMRDGIGMSLRDLYDERLPLYEKYADITVDVNDLSITAAARKVAAARPR